jgi:methionyl-tRNA formyltransferase
MKKILILTDNSDRHFYLANKIFSSYPNNTKIILNGKGIKRSRFEIRKRQMRRPYTFIKNKLLNILYSRYGENLNLEKQRVEKTFFGGEKDYFELHNRQHILDRVTAEDRSLNAPRLIQVIKKYNPDLIFVMGTCLVSQEIINSAPVTLNMHTGLSPYYRGGASNFWPFINRDLNQFGVTIHLMTTGIDSGPIIFSETIKYEKGDTFPDINCKAIIAGTKILLQATQKVIRGDYTVCDQWMKGLVYNSYDYNHFYAYKYYKLLEKLDESARDDNIDIFTVNNGVRIRNA